MKRTIIKVLAELTKPTPDLSYIRGLLEGLVDEESSPTMGGIVNMPAPMVRFSDSVNVKSDEEEIPDFLKPGPIGDLNS